jgi:hypothetical protein
MNPMKRLSLIVLTFAMLTLASCSATKEAPTVEKVAAPAKTAVNGFIALQTVVSQTKGAIEKGDFNQAKTEFSKFEDSWKTVEDGVKAKAPKVYSAIEDGMDQVTQGIKSKNKDQTLAALKALTTNITSAQ